MQQVLKLNSQPNFEALSYFKTFMECHFINSLNKTQYFRLCLSDEAYSEFWLGKNGQTGVWFRGKINVNFVPVWKQICIVYCVTLLPELNVTEDVTNGLSTQRGGRSGLPSADISWTLLPTMGHISNLSAHRQFIYVGQMKYIQCDTF